MTGILNRLKGLRRTLLILFYYRKHPLEYAKKIGVNMPRGGVKLYGNVGWGSEPWIITLGENVHITNGVHFVTHDGGTLVYRKKIPDLEITKPIVVGDDVYIGINTIIMPGVTIGSDVIIGAGSIITHDIPDHSVVVGVPARVIKSTKEYLKKLEGNSLHLGHLRGKEKDQALREYYGYKGPSKGIYW